MTKSQIPPRRSGRPGASPSAAISTCTASDSGRCGSPALACGVSRLTPMRPGACCVKRFASVSTASILAQAYGPGISERLIAEALHPYPDGLVIATKGGVARRDRDDPGRPDGRRSGCEPTAKAVSSACAWTGSIFGSCTASTLTFPWTTRSARSASCRTKGRSDTSGLGGHRRATPRRSCADRRRYRAESFQLRRPSGRGRPRRVRDRRHRFHPLVPARHRPACRTREPAHHSSPAPSRHAFPARAGLAAASLACHAAHPWYLIDHAPTRQRQRSVNRTGPRRTPRA